MPRPCIEIGSRPTSPVALKSRAPGTARMRRYVVSIDADSRGSLSTMDPCPRTCARTTPSCWCRSAGRRSPTTSSRSSRTSPAAAASRASGSRRSASTTTCSAGRSPINDQNRSLLGAIREDLAGAGIDLPVYWGNRNWDPYLVDAVDPDARRRHHAGRELPDRRPTRRTPRAGSTARTSPRPPPRSRARRGSTGCGPTSTTRGSSSRSSTRPSPRWPSCPTTCATAPTSSSSPTRSRST